MEMGAAALFFQKGERRPFLLARIGEPSKVV